MRHLAVLALFLAAVAMASPAENKESNEPVVPLEEDRCRPGYERCIAVRENRLALASRNSELTHTSRDAWNVTWAENVDT
jgi:hypothetical protein